MELEPSTRFGALPRPPLALQSEARAPDRWHGWPPAASASSFALSQKVIACALRSARTLADTDAGAPAITCSRTGPLRMPCRRGRQVTLPQQARSSRVARSSVQAATMKMIARILRFS
jgi:hypothetical protein